MATETIGTSSRQRSTVQLWEDNIPGTLTEAATGECYNDTEFSSSSQHLTISGHTGAYDITLKCATGQSWTDNANVRTNAKKYNQSNGVGFNCSSSAYLTVIYISQARFFLRGIQLKVEGYQSRPINAGDASDTYIKDVIVDLDDSYSSQTGITISGSSAKVINASVYLRNTSGTAFGILNSSQAIACDAIRDPVRSAAGTGFSALYGTNVLQSSTAFGFTDPASASPWHATNSKYNACNNASGLPGTNNQHSVTFSSTTPWTNTTAATLDMRPIAATSLIDNGYLDSTNAANDCTATARDSSPTIGSWEYSAGGGGGSTDGFHRIPESMNFKPLSGVY